MRILRFVAWFDRQSNDLIGEMDIDVNLLDLQNEFNVDKGNPMYDCWEIRKENLPFFEKLTDLQFDLSKYIYFIEAANSK